MYIFRKAWISNPISKLYTNRRLIISPAAIFYSPNFDSRRITQKPCSFSFYYFITQVIKISLVGFRYCVIGNFFYSNMKRMTLADATPVSFLIVFQRRTRCGIVFFLYSLLILSFFVFFLNNKTYHLVPKRWKYNVTIKHALCYVKRQYFSELFVSAVLL